VIAGAQYRLAPGVHHVLAPRIRDRPLASHADECGLPVEADAAGARRTDRHPSSKDNRLQLVEMRDDDRIGNQVEGRAPVGRRAEASGAPQGWDEAGIHHRAGAASGNDASAFRHTEDCLPGPRTLLHPNQAVGLTLGKQIVFASAIRADVSGSRRASRVMLCAEPAWVPRAWNRSRPFDVQRSKAPASPVPRWRAS
jgi:hypothetical protein